MKGTFLNGKKIYIDWSQYDFNKHQPRFGIKSRKTRKKRLKFNTKKVCSMHGILN